MEPRLIKTFPIPGSLPLLRLYQEPVLGELPGSVEQRVNRYSRPGDGSRQSAVRLHKSKGAHPVDGARAPMRQLYFQMHTDSS
jgi:hypothetical protein